MHLLHVGVRTSWTSASTFEFSAAITSIASQLAAPFADFPGQP